MRTNVLDTSIDAYYAMPNTKKAGQADRIEAVVKFLCSGVPGADASLQEIYKWYQARYPSKQDHIEYSTVSARVNELIAAKRLGRRTKDQRRKCSITNIGIRAVFIPSKQIPLFQ